MAKAKDSFDAPDPIPGRAVTMTTTTQGYTLKSEARKILEKQIVVLDAFKDFPLLEEVKETRRGVSFMAREGQVEIAEGTNASEMERLRYY